jgi:hypothetical protein
MLAGVVAILAVAGALVFVVGGDDRHRGGGAAQDRSRNPLRRGARDRLRLRTAGSACRTATSPGARADREDRPRRRVADPSERASTAPSPVRPATCTSSASPRGARGA